MKKINLMDIMESLNSDDVDGATAALHEWFVEQGKQVQAQISGVPVAEADPAPVAMQTYTVIVRSLKDNMTGEEDEYRFFYETYRKDFQAGSATEAEDMADSEMADCAYGDDLVDEYGWEATSSGYTDDGHGEGLEVYHVDVAHTNEAVVDEADADPAKAFRASLNKAVAVMKKAGVLTPQDEQLIAQARADSSADALKGLSPKAAGMAAKLIKAPVAASGINWEGIQLSGDPKTDAKGWAGIAQYLINYAEQGVANAEDELDSDDFDFIIDCASRALHMFQQGDVEGGLSEMMPDANAQDLIAGSVGPDNYNDYFFYRNTGATVESVVESEETDECEEEKVDESFDDLVAELNEAFKGLETVSDKLQNVEGAQVGEQGKVPVNTKATLPSHKGKDRLGGDPVEIKGKGHTGHALEKAPKVVDVKVKNTVQNGKEELKKVADKGDASALLNKKDGKENTQSPISGKGAKGLKK